LNIIDAVKSGRRIRRASWHGSDYGWFDLGNEGIEIDGEDILADDWIVEPVTITREKFEEAWKKSLYPSCMLETFKLRIVEELGL
jgi:hypothetical protein